MSSRCQPFLQRYNIFRLHPSDFSFVSLTDLEYTFVTSKIIYVCKGLRNGYGNGEGSELTRKKPKDFAQLTCIPLSIFANKSNALRNTVRNSCVNFSGL